MDMLTNIIVEGHIYTCRCRTFSTPNLPGNQSGRHEKRKPERLVTQIILFLVGSQDGFSGINVHCLAAPAVSGTEVEVPLLACGCPGRCDVEELDNIRCLVPSFT